MRKNLKSIVSVLCLLSLALSLFSCADDSNTKGTETIYHTVSFNTNGGTSIESVQVAHDNLIPKPADPVLDNYIFDCWRLDDIEVAFDVRRVTEDITLEARWIKASSMFSYVPFEDEIAITKINFLNEYETLIVPSLIDGKKVVAVLDETFENLSTQYANNIVFPETLRYVGNKAFSNASEVNLKFNGTLTHIGQSAFEGCSSIESLSLGTGITSIPLRAFAACSSIKKIELPDGIQTIEENAFDECTNLTLVVLPATLTLVEDAAFKNSGLKNVFYKGTQEQFEQIEILGNNEKLIDATLYLYSESKPTNKGNYWHYGNNNSPVIW